MGAGTVVRDMFGNALTMEQALALKRKKPPCDRDHLVALRLSRGLHPHRGDKVGPAGETCGSCTHHLVRRFSGRYHKCRLGPDSNGPGTDIRVRWPSCERWAATGTDSANAEAGDTAGVAHPGEH